VSFSTTVLSTAKESTTVESDGVVSVDCEQDANMDTAKIAKITFFISLKNFVYQLNKYSRKCQIDKGVGLKFIFNF